MVREEGELERKSGPTYTFPLSIETGSLIRGSIPTHGGFSLGKDRLATEGALLHKNHSFFCFRDDLFPDTVVKLQSGDILFPRQDAGQAAAHDFARRVCERG